MPLLIFLYIRSCSAAVRFETALFGFKTAWRRLLIRFANKVFLRREWVRSTNPAIRSLPSRGHDGMNSFAIGPTAGCPSDKNAYWKQVAVRRTGGVKRPERRTSVRRRLAAGFKKRTPLHYIHFNCCPLADSVYAYRKKGYRPRVFDWTIA